MYYVRHKEHFHYNRNKTSLQWFFKNLVSVSEKVPNTPIILVFKVTAFVVGIICAFLLAQMIKCR